MNIDKREEKINKENDLKITDLFLNYKNERQIINKRISKIKINGW